MTRFRKKTSRLGCSGIVGLFLLAFAVFAAFFWPSYLDSHGTFAAGLITDKSENIRILDGEWFRRLQITADYSIPGQPVKHGAICDVEEQTYDSLHVGNAVPVHYFAALLHQPFLSSSDLAPCSTAASLGLGSALLPRFIVTFASLLVILFFWRVLRIRIFAWLLFPWIVFAFAYIGLPRLEPEPQHPMPATATVDRVVTITTIGDMSPRRAIPLQHPYQIVVLTFVPPGLDSPVKAVDKIDANSVSNLNVGQTVPILYDAAHPRTARLQQGTRQFPGQALKTVILICVACVLLIAIVEGVKRFFSRLGRSVLGRS